MRQSTVTHITLPWPVSVNAMYRSIVRGKYAQAILSKRGRQYRKDAALAIKCSPAARDEPFTGQVRLDIHLYPPTRRKFDCDNMVKCVQDAMTHAGIWEDDSQVKILRVEKCEVVKGGKAEVYIHEVFD